MECIMSPMHNPNRSRFCVPSDLYLSINERNRDVDVDAGSCIDVADDRIIRYIKVKDEMADIIAVQPRRIVSILL